MLCLPSLESTRGLRFDLDYQLRLNLSRRFATCARLLSILWSLRILMFTRPPVPQCCLPSGWWLCLVVVFGGGWCCVVGGVRQVCVSVFALSVHLSD